LGTGKAALGEIIEKVRESGAKTLFLCVLDTNLPAISFYKKMGFVFHSTTRLDNPNFKEELKGMYRMYLELQPN
jgi:ribosomal protein S18 acetylase RimI-like enzyme